MQLILVALHLFQIQIDTLIDYIFSIYIYYRPKIKLKQHQKDADNKMFNLITQCVKIGSENGIQAPPIITIENDIDKYNYKNQMLKQCIIYLIKIRELNTDKINMLYNVINNFCILINSSYDIDELKDKGYNDVNND